MPPEPTTARCNCGTSPPTLEEQPSGHWPSCPAAGRTEPTTAPDLDAIRKRAKEAGDLRTADAFLICREDVAALVAEVERLRALAVQVPATAAADVRVVVDDAVELREQLEKRDARIAVLTQALEPFARAARLNYPDSACSMADYKRAAEVLAEGRD